MMLTLLLVSFASEITKGCSQSTQSTWWLILVSEPSVITIRHFPLLI